jgi:hypothetical protein
MWHHGRASTGRLVRASAPLLLALAAAGCGDGSGVGRTLPVNGTITLDDKPLTAASTVVLFKPDKAKGNLSTFEPTGTVDEQGHYRLVTGGKKGAPPGWYKVCVTATAGPTQGGGGRAHRPAARSLVPSRYGQAATTPVAVEVVEDPPPGAYDLKLTGGGSPGT